MTRRRRLSVAGGLVLVALAAYLPPTGRALSLSSSFFLGNRITPTEHHSSTATLTMRKQKASDRRTRRMQRGENVAVDISSKTLTSSPMASAGWQHKKISNTVTPTRQQHGRGRARKRSNLYNTLSSYHGNFLSLLTAEYRAEVRHGHWIHKQARDSGPNLSHTNDTCHWSVLKLTEHTLPLTMTGRRSSQPHQGIYRQSIIIRGGWFCSL